MDVSERNSGTYTQRNPTVYNSHFWRREGRQPWLYYSTERLGWLHIQWLYIPAFKISGLLLRTPS